MYLCIHKQYILLALQILDDVGSEVFGESNNVKEFSLQIYPANCVS